MLSCLFWSLGKFEGLLNSNTSEILIFISLPKLKNIAVHHSILVNTARLLFRVPHGEHVCSTASYLLRIFR